MKHNVIISGTHDMNGSPSFSLNVPKENTRTDSGKIVYSDRMLVSVLTNESNFDTMCLSPDAEPAVAKKGYSVKLPSNNSDFINAVSHVLKNITNLTKELNELAATRENDGRK